MNLQSDVDFVRTYKNNGVRYLIENLRVYRTVLEMPITCCFQLKFSSIIMPRNFASWSVRLSYLAGLVLNKMQHFLLLLIEGWFVTSLSLAPDH